MKKPLKSIVILILILVSASAIDAQTVSRVSPTKKQKDSLRNEVAQLVTDDQRYRWMIMLGETNEQKLNELKTMDDALRMQRIKDARDNKVGISKTQKDSLRHLQSQLDTVNFIKLTGIIRTFGFPHGYIDPIEASTTLLHAADLLTNKHFDTLRQEVDNGNLPSIEYATIYDRIHVERKQPELYYVLEHYDAATKTSKLHTPADIAATNKARKEIGMKKFKK